MKHAYNNKKLKTITVDEKSISSLLTAMENTGFQGKKLAQAVSQNVLTREPEAAFLVSHLWSEPELSGLWFRLRARLAKI